MQAIEQVFGLRSVTIESIGVGQGQTARYKILADGRQFIGKHFGPAYRLEWVHFEFSLLSRLAKGGMPVASAIATKDLSPFALVDGRPLLLCNWVEGSLEWPTTPETAERLGRAFAEMHLVSNDLECDVAARVYDVDRLVDRPLRLLEPFSVDKGQFEALVEAVKPLREKIAAVPHDAGTFGPIHGDLHQGNCVFTEEGLAVFDFALCGVGYRAYDLTGYLWPMRDGKIDDPDMAACCEGFLRGYRSERPLTREEEAAIPAFVQVRTLWETGDWVDTGTGREQPEDVPKAIAYMIDHFPKM